MLFAPDGLSIFSTVVWNVAVLTGFVLLEFVLLYWVERLKRQARDRIEQILLRVVWVALIVMVLCALAIWVDIILL